MYAINLSMNTPIPDEGESLFALDPNLVGFLEKFGWPRGDL